MNKCGTCSFSRKSARCDVQQPLLQCVAPKLTSRSTTTYTTPSFLFRAIRSGNASPFSADFAHAGLGPRSLDVPSALSGASAALEFQGLALQLHLSNRRIEQTRPFAKDDELVGPNTRPGQTRHQEQRGQRKASPNHGSPPSAELVISLTGASLLDSGAGPLPGAA